MRDEVKKSENSAYKLSKVNSDFEDSEQDDIDNSENEEIDD